MFFTIVGETFTILRRDRIFIPALVAGFAVLFMISVIGEFTIEDQIKVYFDMGFGILNISGAIVAMLWGTKVIADSKSDGAINLQLAAPISRAKWLLAKYTGLALSLIVFGVILAAMWFMILLIELKAPFQSAHALIICGFIVGWLVIAAAAVFFSTIASQAVAMFGTLSLWVLGLTAESVNQVLRPESPLLSRIIAKMLIWGWNLRQFDLTSLEKAQSQSLGLSLIYAASMIASFMALAGLLFRKKDLT